MDQQAVINIAVYVLIYLAVTASCLFTGASKVYKPIAGIFGNIFAIEAGTVDTSELVQVCNQFYQDIFRLDLYEEKYKEEFAGIFGQDFSYLKAKAMCGTLIPIVSAADSSGNINRTVSSINEVYSPVYPGFEIDAEAVSELVRTEEKQVWLDAVTNMIKDEVDGRVLS